MFFLPKIDDILIFRGKLDKYNTNIKCTLYECLETNWTFCEHFMNIWYMFANVRFHANFMQTVMNIVWMFINLLNSKQTLYEHLIDVHECSLLGGTYMLRECLEDIARWSVIHWQLQFGMTIYPIGPCSTKCLWVRYSSTAYLFLWHKEHKHIA